jgi:hemoglobin-like flavoprotein
MKAFCGPRDATLAHDRRKDAQIRQIHPSLPENDTFTIIHFSVAPTTVIPPSHTATPVLAVQKLIGKLHHPERIFPMTPNEKNIVRATWQKIVPIADTAVDLFYDKLFEIDPELRPLFENVDMGAQKKKLLQALAMTVAQLDALEVLAPQLAELGRRHAAYGVQNEHYDSVGAALWWTLEQGLGDDWNTETAQAWTAAYTLVAETMKSAANTDGNRPSNAQRTAA